MGLTANGVLNGFSGRLFGAAQGAFASGMVSAYHNATSFGQITSVPQGHNSQNAIRMTVKVGGNVSAKARAEAEFDADIRGAGNLEATLSGEFDMIAAGNVASNGYAVFEAEADMVAGLSAIGSMSANMDLLARPSANDIAQEVWNAAKSGLTSPGTTGKALVDAEAAAKLAAALSA